MDVSISLEAKTFYSATILVAGVGLLSTVVNTLNQAPFLNIFLAILTLGTGVVFYLCSLLIQYTKMLHLPFMLVLMSISIAYWFVNNGYAGSTPIFLMSLVVLNAMLIEGKLAMILQGALLTATAITITFTYLHPDLFMQEFTEQNRSIDISITLIICMFATGALVQFLTTTLRVERKKNENLYLAALSDKKSLEKTLNELRVLKGILPICSFCKKIRDDKNNWQDMENYITLRSNAKFSHSFCPDCGEKHYAKYLS